MKLTLGRMALLSRVTLYVSFLAAALLLAWAAWTHDVRLMVLYIGLQMAIAWKVDRSYEEMKAIAKHDHRAAGASQSTDR